MSKQCHCSLQLFFIGATYEEKLLKTGIFVPPLQKYDDIFYLRTRTWCLAVIP
jgi:hypothetical protein